MFNRLLESNRNRQRRLGGAIASTMVHTLLIALAVRATQLTAATPRITETVITPIYQPPQPQESQPRQVTRGSPIAVARNAVVPPPTEEIVLTTMRFDLPGIPEPRVGGMSANDFGLSRVSDGGGTGAAPNVAGDQPFTWDVVDKAIVAIPGTAAPRYPSSLQRAGLEGDVRAQFVVDTLGRVERGSIRVLDSTHELFALAVRDALARARFKPAEAGGHVVRQLAEQTFTFRITK